MSVAKLLAEWFWTDRWAGSSGRELAMEPRGLYREMMTEAWRRGCSLPTDHETIRRLTGCTEAEWERCWPLVSKYWHESNGRLINDTQVEVYKAAHDRHERAVAAGKKGAAARWGQDATADATALPTHEPSECQPSPSPVTKNQSPQQTVARSRERPANGYTREACDDWQKVFKGAVPGGEVGKSMKRLLAATEDEWVIVRKVWRYYLTHEREEFVKPGTFASKYGVWRRRYEQKQPPDNLAKATTAGKNKAALWRWLKQEAKP